jgi:hypothetical protein
MYEPSDSSILIGIFAPGVLLVLGLWALWALADLFIDVSITFIWPF